MATRRILVPIDLSDYSREALRFAIAWARKLGATIDVLHVWEPPPQVTPDNLIWMHGGSHAFWENAKADLQQQVDQIVTAEDPQRDVVRNTEVVADYVVNSIVAKLERDAYDMCILGTRGRTGLARLLLGSVAGRVIRLASCPVITVPARAKAPAVPPVGDAEVRTDAASS